jgi:hypothetical protein
LLLNARSNADETTGSIFFKKESRAKVILDNPL